MLIFPVIHKSIRPYGLFNKYIKIPVCYQLKIFTNNNDNIVVDVKQIKSDVATLSENSKTLKLKDFKSE